MKRFKKFGALLLAEAMMLSMSVTAFAANSNATLTGGVDGTGSAAVTNLVIKKEIKAYNNESYNVRLPKIGYVYTIDTVSDVASATVTDLNNKSASVNATNGITVTDVFNSVTSSVEFSETDSVETNSSGAIVSKDVTFNVKDSLGTSVTHAGIYRFKVTESLKTESGYPTTKAAAGISESSDYNATKYLDVYISNVSDGEGETNLKVTGFVLFDSNAGKDQLTSNDASTKKTDGWGSGKGSSNLNVDLDEYKTYNLKVTKTITGSLADKSHEFPISLTISKATELANNATVDVLVSNGTLSSGTSGTASVGSGVSIGASLKDGGELIIKGIPYYPDETSSKYATISEFSETNNTNDAYTATIALTKVTGITAPTSAINGGGSSATATAFTVNNSTLEADDAIIAVTNTLDAISPTGVVLRFAPYILILTAGVVLLALTKRRRIED